MPTRFGIASLLRARWDRDTGGPAPADGSTRHHRRQLAAGLVAGCLSMVVAPAGAFAEILVAVVGPMTGPNFSGGLAFAQGVEIAIDAVNAAGGLLGQRVRYAAFDDACNEDRAVAAASAAIAAKPSLVVGHDCSAASIVAAPLYASAAIMQISPTSTNPKLTELGIPTLFRVIGRDDRQGEAAANLIAARWPKRRIAVVDDGQVYGKGLADVVRNGLAARHIPVVLSESYKPEAPSYANLVAKLKQDRINLLYLGGYWQDVGLILRQVAAAGLPIQCLSGDSANSETIVQSAGDGIDRLAFTSFPDPNQNPAAAPVLAAARAKQIQPSSDFLLAYAAVEVWAAAVRQSQSFDAGQVASALHSTSVNIVLGPTSFDAKGDIAGPASEWAWYRWNHGRTERLEPQATAAAK